MTHKQSSPKGILRDDHLLLVGEDLATLSSCEIQLLISDVLRSVEAMAPAEFNERDNQPAFLAKSLAETMRVLNSPPPVSPYRRYARASHH